MKSLLAIILVLAMAACGPPITDPKKPSEPKSESQSIESKDSEFKTPETPVLECLAAARLDEIYEKCAEVERKTNPTFARRMTFHFSIAECRRKTCLELDTYSHIGLVSRPPSPSDEFEKCMGKRLDSMELDHEAMEGRDSEVICAQSQTPKSSSGPYLKKLNPIPDHACKQGKTSCWLETLE